MPQSRERHREYMKAYRKKKKAERQLLEVRVGDLEKRVSRIENEFFGDKKRRGKK